MSSFKVQDISNTLFGTRRVIKNREWNEIDLLYIDIVCNRWVRIFDMHVFLITEIFGIHERILIGVNNVRYTARRCSDRFIQWKQYNNNQNENQMENNSESNSKMYWLTEF
jgi:hypothetical protein